MQRQDRHAHERTELVGDGNRCVCAIVRRRNCSNWPRLPVTQATQDPIDLAILRRLPASAARPVSAAYRRLQFLPLRSCNQASVKALVSEQRRACSTSVKGVPASVVAALTDG